MSMSINGSGMKFNNTGSINTNSKQYKAAMEMFGKDAEMADAFLTEEQKLIQEVFGFKENRIKTWMSWFDADGNYKGDAGVIVPGMVATGIPISQRHKIISISEDARQKMFDETKRHFVQENGVANGDTTRRSQVYREYQLSVPVGDRLKGTWTLQQYENAYRQAMYDACKAKDPKWDLGKPLPAGALDGITRESIDKSLVKGNGEYGETLTRKSVNISV